MRPASNAFASLACASEARVCGLREAACPTSKSHRSVFRVGVDVELRQVQENLVLQRLMIQPLILIAL
jgi:hypothetical protein